MTEPDPIPDTPAGPLSGLLVADFSRVLAGPYCTMLLADLGADVIKVESPGGDDTRQWVPPVNDEGRSTYFLAINRNKRSVALNLKDQADLAAAQELARRADVFVQNFKPGGLARYGLDYETVSATNPGIVYASISGFGAGGGKDLPGYDLMVQAMSGLMSLTGDPGGPPFRAGISVFDVIAGLHTAFGIVAALYDRAATGAGQHVEA
ncbi:MAG TPA: CoA transferase, partial [Streptosporangiaceae bacterium]